MTVGCLALALCWQAWQARYADEPAYRAAYQTLVRNYVLGVALFCPLSRIALAPLALAWNRHR